jgi:hypothetical protein
MHIDKKAEHRDVRNGYKLGCRLAIEGAQYFVLWLSSLESSLGVFVVSGALVMFQYVALEIMIPALKLCFGCDHRKLWLSAVPGFVLALELGPCLLLLGSDMRTLEFWLLLLMQELNSAAKNTRKYDEWYVALCARLRRPVKEEDRTLMEEQRATLAPCDNIAEIASPLVIIMVIGLEAVFDGLPTIFRRAPYFAQTGIMGGWRNQRFRGEALIMMAVAFVVRVMFCWLEVSVRNYQRRRDNGSIGATDIDPHGTGGDNRSRALTRQPSLAELYQRGAASLRRPSAEELYQRVAALLRPSITELYQRGTAARLVLKKGGPRSQICTIASLILRTPLFRYDSWLAHCSRCSRLSS